MSPATRRDLVPVRESVHEGEAGIALPAAMFTIVAASIMGAGMLAFANLSTQATVNQERATRAVQVADAGVAHALSLLRGGLKSQSFTRILRGGDNVVPPPTTRSSSTTVSRLAMKSRSRERPSRDIPTS